MRGLYIQKVSKSFGSVRALDDVELLVEQGEFMVTLWAERMRQDDIIISDLRGLKPDKGLIWMGDREITNLPIEERNIGYVPQDFRLFPT